MSAERKYRDYYTEGTSVRKLHTAPDFEERRREIRRERELERRREIERSEYEQRKREQERKRRRQLERNKGINRSSMIVLSISLALTMYICIGYVHGQITLVSMDKSIASLEDQILSLKDENSAIKDSEEETMTLEEIYKIATSELGMVHPNDSQIITYESNVSDYVRQYSDVPRSGGSSSTSITNE